MEITLGYAIALGGVLFIPFLINFLPCLPYFLSFSPNFLQYAWRYLTYPYLIQRHRLLGPWMRADLIIQLSYIAGNCFCLIFRVTDIATAGIRAGHLSLINMLPLFLGPHLSFIADILGVSLSKFRLIHRSAGLMSFGLVCLYVLAVAVSRTEFALDGTANISAAVGGSSLGLIVVLSWPLLRKRFYEAFLRFHQALATTIAVSALLHTPSTFFPRLYFYIALGLFITTSAFEGLLLLRYNGIFTCVRGRKLPIVGEVFKYLQHDENSPVQVTIITQKDVEMDAGKYINILIPSPGIRSMIQSHPFVVASWTGRRQTKLELIIEPRGGWTKKLQSRAITTSGQSGGLGRVIFTGPHGVSVPIDDYEFIFMVASGYGIVAQLPLLERLVQGTLAREVRARRICLVWEIEDRGLYHVVYPLLNWVLPEDRKLGNNCTLAISLYSNRLELDGLGQRIETFNQSLPLRNVFDAETDEIGKRRKEEDLAIQMVERKRAEQIERGRKEVILETHIKESAPDLPTLPVCTRSPRMLVTVSATTEIRDELRSVLGVEKDITLRELDYQPLT